MKNKNKRLDTIKLIISTREIGSQEELRAELENEGFELTQATLSRDLKQLKVAKASTLGGKYVYVLPNNTLYKRVNTPWQDDGKSPRDVGFLSLIFSNNIAVIKTRPGYASSLAYDIDSLNLEEVCGTIAGDDTIMVIMKENASRVQLIHGLEPIIPGIR